MSNDVDLNLSSRHASNARFPGYDKIMADIVTGRSRLDNKVRLPSFTIRT